MDRATRVQMALEAYLEEFNQSGYAGADASMRKHVRRDVVELILDAAFPDGVGDEERAAKKEQGT